MTERREHFALDWIKRELDETLKTARLALEAYAETKGDETRMRACLTHLHQVHGTLLMLELTGVSALSDEMEQLEAFGRGLTTFIGLLWWVNGAPGYIL